MFCGQTNFWVNDWSYESMFTKRAKFFSKVPNSWLCVVLGSGSALYLSYSLLPLLQCKKCVYFKFCAGKSGKIHLHNRNLYNLKHWIDFVPLQCLLEHHIHWHNNKILKDIASLQNYHWYNIWVWVSNNLNMFWLVHIHNSLICLFCHFWGC